jgi:hypothetical protein
MERGSGFVAMDEKYVSFLYMDPITTQGVGKSLQIATNQWGGRLTVC